METVLLTNSRQASLILRHFQASCFNLKIRAFGRMAVAQAFCFRPKNMIENILFMCEFSNTRTNTHS